MPKRYEPRHEKTCLRGLRPGKTQTGLLSFRSSLESWNFGDSKYRYYAIQAVNNKGADQTARMHGLIYVFAVHIWQKQVFSRCGSYNDGMANSEDLDQQSDLCLHSLQNLSVQKLRIIMVATKMDKH